MRELGLGGTIGTELADAALLGHMMTTGAAGLFLIGLYAMVVERDLVRMVLGLVLVGSGVNLFLVSVGFRPEAVAPILVGGAGPVAMVDPLPQALVLTSIVIDVGVLALALALAIRVHETLGTLDTREVQKRIAEVAAPPRRAAEGDTGMPARGPVSVQAEQKRLEEVP